MFEDLSRLIDHATYLATQTCIERLQEGRRRISHHDDFVDDSSERAPGTERAVSLSTRPVTSADDGKIRHGSGTWPPPPPSDQAGSGGEEVGATRPDFDDARAPTSLSSSFRALERKSPGLLSLAKGFERLRLGYPRDTMVGNNSSSSRGTSAMGSLGISDQSKNRRIWPSERSGVMMMESVASMSNQYEGDNDQQQEGQGPAASLANGSKRMLATPSPPAALTRPLMSMGTGMGVNALVETTTTTLKTWPQPFASRSPRVVHIPRPSPHRSSPSGRAFPGEGVVMGASGPNKNSSSSSSNSHNNSGNGRFSSDTMSHTNNNRTESVLGLSQPRRLTTATTTTSTNTMPPRVSLHSQVEPVVEANNHPQHHQQQQQEREGGREELDDDDDDEDEDPTNLSNITAITLLVHDLPQIAHFYTRVFAVPPIHEDDVSATFPFNQGRLSITLMDSREASRSLPQQQQQQQQAQQNGSRRSSDEYFYYVDDGSGGGGREEVSRRQGLLRQEAPARYRDVGMSVEVKDIEGVWERLTILREGKGKGRDGEGGGDGLRFGNLAATGLGPEFEVGGGYGGGARCDMGEKRIVFCDPAGYHWEITERASRG